MLHVAKTYKVEYGNTEAFNYKHDQFYELLQELGGEPNWVDCNDEPCDSFECTVGDYNDAVQNLEVYIADPNLIEEGEEIGETLKGLKMTAEQVLKVMKSYLKEADTSDGYLHFAAW